MCYLSIFYLFLTFLLFSLPTYFFYDKMIYNMTISLIISAITALALILVIIFKPYIQIKKFGIGLYWVVALLGAILLILFNTILVKDVINGFTSTRGVNPIQILILFISMTSISVFLEDAGFFDIVANFIFERCKISQTKLFFILYFTVAILTIFTSNDIIILTFTPPICIFSKKAKISPIPYLFGEFIAANTFSLALVIGNPTNIYLAESVGIGFIEYLYVMILPALLCGAVSGLTIYLLFKKQLAKPISNENATCTLASDYKKTTRMEKLPLIVALCHLIVCIILLAVSDFIGLEMWLICLILALSLLLFNISYRLITKSGLHKVGHILKKLPYELIPFVLSMFILVLSLKINGVTQILANFLSTNTTLDTITFGLTSTICANLLNNIPMSVLFAEIVPSGNLYALFGSIVGSNIGAFITPVGALAGIMWNKILKNYQVGFSFKKFILYGSLISIPALIFSLLPLLILI